MLPTTAAGTLGKVLRALVALLSFCSFAVLGAQPPALTPTANTTIVVPSGVLHYSSIHVPAGVTVRFVAPGFGSLSVPGMPAVVRCDGDAIVHGSVSVAGDYVNGRPAGWVTTGQGTYGVTCAGSLLQPSGGGQRAGTCGSDLPFSLAGGSQGGDHGTFGPAWIFGPPCQQLLYSSSGGDGGGTLVLLASGRIEVYGTVTADGGGGSAGGSGGSILMRGDAGVVVRPGGSVTARGGAAPTAPAPWPPLMSVGAPGYVRLDAWGALPVIQGMVDPAPRVLELPYLRSLFQPTSGRTWTLDIFAPDTAWVYVGAALAPATGMPMTQFGPLGLDLATTVGIALTVPQPGHDPVATVQWQIPRSPALVGFAMWIQAIAVPPGLPARLTNTLAVVVQ